MHINEHSPGHEYSPLKVCLHNLPYVCMVLLGAAILLAGIEPSGWRWAAVVAYIVYGIVGAFWIILFVCPYCPSYGRNTCPCGYGAAAALLVAQGDRSLFASKFKRNIPAIVPLWFIPLVAGVAFAVMAFSWLLAGLLAAFALEAFILLPLVSMRAGCRQCPQAADCPWMGKRRSPDGNAAAAQEAPADRPDPSGPATPPS